MANSADPDQLASDLIYSLQNSVYPGSAGQGLKYLVDWQIVETRSDCSDLPYMCF